MTDRLRFTILGCGSSGGVPRLGNVWGACDPKNPKNTRLRCSLLIERISAAGTTRVLVDASPDMRQQLLSAGIGELDAVIFTHEHADHTHGLDDLRMIVINMRERLDVFADGPTSKSLMDRFGYAFKTPQGSDYPPILNLHNLDPLTSIDGKGGTIEIKPFAVTHGTIQTSCLRVGHLAYCPDISDIPAQARWGFEGLEYLILDALRYTPHPSHAHLDQSLEWIKEFKPQQAVLTNLHIDLDYETLMAETPDHIVPAYDGLTIEFDA